MKIKTSELTGMPLDFAVVYAEASGLDTKNVLSKGVLVMAVKRGAVRRSTDWAQGGPLIERNLITIFRHDEEWFAHSQLSTPEDFHGDTPLIAAMRCYVASKLGDEVEIPEELT